VSGFVRFPRTRHRIFLPGASRSPEPYRSTSATFEASSCDPPSHSLYRGPAMSTDYAPRPMTSALSNNFRQQPQSSQPPRIYNPHVGQSPAGRGAVSAPTTPITQLSSPFGSATTLLGQQHQQLGRMRNARSPLYVPAVLRPTEKNGKQRSSPPTRSSGSSLIEQDSGASTPTGDGNSIWGDSWRRVLTGGLCDSNITRVVGDEWNDEVLGAVTGPPTRNHWKVSPLTPPLVET
jgi:hypothetical protein